MKENREIIKQKLANHYDESAQEYHRINYIAGTSYSPLRYRQYYIEKMIETLGLSSDSRILDVGCGPGELVLSLLRQDYQVWAVDISRSMVEETNRAVNREGFPDWTRASVGDIEDISFSDNFFDVVVAAGVLEYQKNDEKALMEMTRVLKTGGHLILNVTVKGSYVRALEAPWRWVKQNAVLATPMNFLRSTLLGKGISNGHLKVPSRRTHCPRSFDRTLDKFGFKKISHKYFGFTFLPKPCDSIFPSVNRKTARLMEESKYRAFDSLAGGYLLMGKKLAGRAQ